MLWTLKNFSNNIENFEIVSYLVTGDVILLIIIKINFTYGANVFGMYYFFLQFVTQIQRHPV